MIKKVHKLSLEGLLVIETNVFTDERGYFSEIFHLKEMEEIVPEANFVQDNLSLSHNNVVRGLHYQLPPFAQGKLVTVLSGKVWDVAVDIRKNSPTFGQYEGIELEAGSGMFFYVPPGFAHGFATLKGETIFLYKCTNYYHKPSEQGILWNDSYLNIDWKVSLPLVSSKDMNLPKFQNAIYFD